MAQEIPCVGCGRTERPITIWKGTDVCCENCRKIRDEPKPIPARCLCNEQPPGSIRVCPLHKEMASAFRLQMGGAVGGVLGHPYWVVEIASDRPVNHTPCWAGVRDDTTLGDEVEWFECLKCGARKSGRRIGHEAGEH